MTVCLFRLSARCVLLSIEVSECIIETGERPPQVKRQRNRDTRGHKIALRACTYVCDDHFFLRFPTLVTGCLFNTLAILLPSLDSSTLIGNYALQRGERCRERGKRKKGRWRVGGKQSWQCAIEGSSIALGREITAMDNRSCLICTVPIKVTHLGIEACR